MKNPTLIPIPTERNDPDPVMTDSDLREGLSLSQQGQDNFSQWGMGISVGFFTETTSFLRNPMVERLQLLK